MSKPILIVDDEHMITDMLGAFLSLSGFESHSAHTAGQMWDALAYLAPQAILLDLMLPDENGLNVLRQLRSSAKTAQMPVIIISAYEPPLIDEALASGADGYLRKPITVAQLRQALTHIGLSS